MKNKLYMSLFAIAVSGSVAVVATEVRTADGTYQLSGGALARSVRPMNHNFWGGTVATNSVPNWSQIVANDKPNTLGATRSTSTVLGGNASTYAPSKEESFLRKLANTLKNSKPNDAMQLQNIADKIGQLRINDYKMFKKYFESKNEAVAKIASTTSFKDFNEDDTDGSIESLDNQIDNE